MGPEEARHNVLLDANGQEFVFRQPRNAAELRDVLSAAIVECFVGYGRDGDDHWRLSLIQQWWRGRGEMLTAASGLHGDPTSLNDWRRALQGEAESYLRVYAFFVENGRVPTDEEVLPEVQ